MGTAIKIILGIILILVALIIIGFFVPDNSAKNNALEIRKIAVFVDEEPNNSENQKQIKIATIEVKPLTGDLVLEPATNDIFNIERLEKALTEIKNRPALELTVENYEMINGSNALVMKTISVSKTDTNYIYALRETLTMEFGLKSEIEKTTGEKIYIDQGTVANLAENLRIGVVSISKSDYIDKSGAVNNGLTAVLDLIFVNNSSKNQKIEVYVGKEFNMGEYKLIVDSIDTKIGNGMTGSSSGSVTLLINKI